MALKPAAGYIVVSPYYKNGFTTFTLSKYCPEFKFSIHIILQSRFIALQTIREFQNEII
ncbi:hypothetical protein [Thermoanaerobacterium butyriciformans]|uniref:Uncharacterized protein n=1 Tax=Thermoanaerobacterium butyriciformans TaxID=1702242 RepID=A0ABS4NI56_9THEO|nr:hypothetical protein [Thermoanaerobacterium butyriciformans]